MQVKNKNCRKTISNTEYIVASTADCVTPCNNVAIFAASNGIAWPSSEKKQKNITIINSTFTTATAMN